MSAIEAILQQRRVNGLIHVDLQETVTERLVRTNKNKPACLEHDHHLTLKAQIDTAALDEACE